MLYFQIEDITLTVFYRTEHAIFELEILVAFYLSFQLGSNTIRNGWNKIGSVNNR